MRRHFIKRPVLSSSTAPNIQQECEKYVQDQVKYYKQEYPDCVDDDDFFGYPVDEVAYTFSKSKMVRLMMRQLKSGTQDLEDAWDNAADTGIKMLTSVRGISNMYRNHGQEVPEWLYSDF